MESIVSANKTLSWDGWTVLDTYPSDKGRTSKQGVFANEKWHMQRRFDPTSTGWEIPDKYVR